METGKETDKMKRTYIAPTICTVALYTTALIAETIFIGDGDGRDPNAGQLIRGEHDLQPYSTHLWDEDGE